MNSQGIARGDFIVDYASCVVYAKNETRWIKNFVQKFEASQISESSAGVGTRVRLIKDEVRNVDR